MRNIILLLALASLLPAADYKTQNLVLVTVDGLRWQEVFSGIDPELMQLKEAGMDEADALRDSLWADSAQERRRRLLPFLWDELVPNGVIFGNPERNSQVVLNNKHHFSYPGYSEILTGRPQDDVIDSNDLRPNPSETVLEILRREWELPSERVALLGSWSVFHGIGARDAASIFINAGYREIPPPAPSSRLRLLSELQFELLTPWPTVRHDYITFELALAYLETVKPRALYIAFGETDDWAHDHRYDRVLEAAKYFDASMKVLWEAIQSNLAYRDKTTLLIATDHGRGATPDTWNGHGAKIDGDEHVWLAAIGPDTPARGEAKDAPALTQSDIAPTMLELAGVDYMELEAVEGQPIDWIIGAGGPN